MSVRTPVFLLVLGLMVGCASTTLFTPPTPPQTPPNIVFILADDLGIGDTGVYGSSIIKTPNIDALAANGVRFTEGYVSHPVCSPSRAGLLTGQYQQRLGWEFNPAGRDVNNGLAAGVPTFADTLKARGYATGMIGKWHLGYEEDFHPVQRGFAEYFGVLAGGSIFIDPAAPGVETVGAVGSTRNSRIGVYRNTRQVVVEDYLTDVFTDEAVDFINRHADQPFLLYVAHTAPHTPLQATAKYLDRYRHIEDPATRVYAAMVSSVDDSLGRIARALEENQILENTLIVFLSDNGCASYIGNACSNAPFAGFKRYHQEGGIRVPFIMSWPAKLVPGTFNEPVISLDLLATFGAASGQPVISTDSVNLLPYVTGEKKGVPHDYLYWRSGPTIAIRDEQWKLIAYKRSVHTRADLGSDGRLTPPEDGWSLDTPNGMVTLLYNLVADPGETANLANSHPEVVARLLAKHNEWAKTLGTTPTLPAVRSTLAEMHGETVQLIF